MIISGDTEENLNTVMQNLSTELVSDPGEILSILTESKVYGTAVGVSAPVLGSEICVTGVEDVIIDDDITIVLKGYDNTGYMLERTKLKLSEIVSVCPFKSLFENPYMRTLKQNKGGSEAISQ